MAFHVNPATGDPGQCKAEKGNCPFGSPDEHYDSPEEAREAYEQSNGFPPPVHRNDMPLPEDTLTHGELSQAATIVKSHARTLQNHKNSFVRDARAQDAKELLQLADRLLTEQDKLTRRDLLRVANAAAGEWKAVVGSDNSFVRSDPAKRVPRLKKFEQDMRKLAADL